jgi:hypothetical protein
LGVRTESCPTLQETTVRLRVMVDGTGELLQVIAAGSEPEK